MVLLRLVGILQVFLALDKSKYLPDDGARLKIRGSPKPLQFIPGGDECGWKT